ncbi:MAG: aminodeoxychorismate/anthranilate synthase component II [Bacteroidales bacterium]|nr:aminodeoxychorismate/anthranilate synthase component II [Bacteroidales bacterium]MCF8402336.1 aminodeoxychorismate/anthranilate synthase component II [Bacteroidales bacterium]
MNVLLIDNNDSFTFNLVQIIEETGLCDLEIVRYDLATEKLIEGFDKFVISPGPGIPSDFPKLQDFILKFYTRRDILGVCMGFEAITIAFGGKIISSGKVFHGFTKRTEILETDNSIFKNVPNNFEAGCYHSWIADEISFPKELKVTARAEDGVIMAFRHKKYNVVGVQYHPESIMTKHGKTMILNWLNLSP